MREIYAAGAGWVIFEPRNRSVGGFTLIPVAVARDIRLAMPVAGRIRGESDAFSGTTVEGQLPIEKRCDELMKNSNSPFAVPTARRCLEMQISSVCVQKIGEAT